MQTPLEKPEKLKDRKGGTYRTLLGKKVSASSMGIEIPQKKTRKKTATKRVASK